MKNLFDPAASEEITRRVGQLKPQSTRVWGTMAPPQALAHCSASLEWAVGDTVAPRMFIGRVIRVS
jgi:hypothetical protein